MSPAGIVDRLSADGFDRAEMTALFARPEMGLDESVMAHKLRELFRRKYLPSPPDAPRKAVTVYESCLTDERIAEARQFYRSNLPLLRQVQAAWGVPPEVLAGLLSVETRGGTFLGSEMAARSLASMAATRGVDASLPLLADLSPNGSGGSGVGGFDDEQVAYLSRKSAEKSEWAYKELKALLRYSRQAGTDPAVIPGSVYGAIGVCQFMPSNIATLGHDGDGDGRIDVFNLTDAAHSVGRYLSRSGLKPGRPETTRKALYAYNHSAAYVNTILEIADRVKE
jgi:membrane-bound lytic murein transglycosylase B